MSEGQYNPNEELEESKLYNSAVTVQVKIDKDKISD